MRTLVWTTLSILLLSGVGGSRLTYKLSSRPRPTQRPQHGCRCVPDQWEGVVMKTEHEFDLHDGRHVETGSHERIYYDYSNRRFAIRDLITGHRSVEDHSTVRLPSRYYSFFHHSQSPKPPGRLDLAGSILGVLATFGMSC